MKYSTILSGLLVACLCLTCSIALPIIASATSASISVSGNEGAITVSASASFSTHTFCSGSGENKNCRNDNSGTLYIYENISSYANTYWRASKSGNGSAHWSEVFNGGALAQGEHTFVATATDSKGITNTSTKVITIDNTPVLTMIVGDTEGDMDVKGTVDFKENITGYEGELCLYHNKYDTSHCKYYEGSGPINWTWEELAEKKLNAGRFPQGLQNITAIAIAANGTKAIKHHEFTIDNTPELTLSIGDAEGDINVQGSVDFKENIAGFEGKVCVYLDVVYYGFWTGCKDYEGSAPIIWTWEEIKGHKLNASTLSQGTHGITVIALAANGTEATRYQRFTIDNAPELTLSVGDTDGDMDVKGTVDFKENIVGAERKVRLYLDRTDFGYWYGSMDYEGSNHINWTWEEITGRKLNAGRLSQGAHKITATAIAANGASTSKYHEFTIDNTPELTLSVSNAEGYMNVKGTVDFIENITGNEGRVCLYLDKIDWSTSYRCKDYEGSDSINWSWEGIAGGKLNAGSLSEGDHKIIVRAAAANGTITKKYHELTIDNTPALTLSVADAEGYMDVKGTVDFIENITGNEGRVCLYLDMINLSSRYGCKDYEGSGSINWTWEEIAEKKLNAGMLSQGGHEIIVRAIAANGAITNKYHEFTIDNTPSPIIVGPQNFPDDTFDILGTTTFKENITGNEGTVTLYIKEINAASYSTRGSISYEGKKISWRYSDFTGARMQQSVWGQREILVKAVATAVNGASATVVKGMVIPALGCPTTFGN